MKNRHSRRGRDDRALSRSGPARRRLFYDQGCAALLVLLSIPWAQASPELELSSYYPLVAGARWDFVETDGWNSYAMTRTVLEGSQTLHGITARAVEERFDESYSIVRWMSLSTGLALHREEQSFFGINGGFAAQAPIIFSPSTVRPSSTFDFSNAIADIQAGTPNPTTFPGRFYGSTRVSGPETMTVPAGTFDCFKMEIDYTLEEDGESYREIETWWLAQGVGVVKYTRTNAEWDILGVLRSFNIPSDKAAPSIRVQPQSQSVPVGSNVTLAVSATGTEPMFYFWQFKGVNIPSASTSTLSLTNVQLSQSGEYRVMVSNMVGVATSSAAVLSVTNVVPASAPPRFASAGLSPSKVFEISVAGEAGMTFALQASTDLRTWSVVSDVGPLNGPALWRDATPANLPQRFFRLAGTSGGGPVQVAPYSTLPEPGKLYPAGTTLGGAIFGAEFKIPPAWQGGLRVDSALMLFGSDTKPGLVIGALGFAWDQQSVLSDPELRAGFEMETAGGKTFFRNTTPPTATAANRIFADYQGTDAAGSYYLALDLVTHPNGGFMGFLGITTSDQKSAIKEQLGLFGDGVRIIPRNTSADYMNYLSGRSFKWDGGGSDWYKSTPFGSYNTSAGLSSWSENYAFFCQEGTFEISKTTETIASTTSPSSGFMSLSGSSTTREYGQWTVIDSPEYGHVLLMVTLSGYQAAAIRIEPDGSIMVGEHKMAFNRAFQCP